MNDTARRWMGWLCLVALAWSWSAAAQPTKPAEAVVEDAGAANDIADLKKRLEDLEARLQKG